VQLPYRGERQTSPLFLFVVDFINFELTL